VRLKIYRIGAEAVPGAAEVLAEAFDGYAWTSWTVAADRHRQRLRLRLRGLFRLTVGEVGVPYGETWAELPQQAIGRRPAHR
jgi:hypothetical protein